MPSSCGGVGGRRKGRRRDGGRRRRIRLDGRSIADDEDVVVVRDRPAEFRRQEEEAYRRAGKRRKYRTEARDCVPDRIDRAGSRRRCVDRTGSDRDVRKRQRRSQYQQQCKGEECTSILGRRRTVVDERGEWTAIFPRDVATVPADVVRVENVHGAHFVDWRLARQSRVAVVAVFVVFAVPLPIRPRDSTHRGHRPVHRTRRVASNALRSHMPSIRHTRSTPSPGRTVPISSISITSGGCASHRRTTLGGWGSTPLVRETGRRPDRSIMTTTTTAKKTTRGAFRRSEDEGADTPDNTRRGEGVLRKGVLRRRERP